MEKRRRKRLRRRITCELVVDGKRQSGIVLDVSAGGLFVQTAVTAPPGTVLEVRLAKTRATPEIALRAKVARGVRVPPRLQTVAAGGLGLQVLDPPPEFADLIVGEAGLGYDVLPDGAPEARPDAKAETKPEAPTHRFRARLQVTGGMRSRIVTVECKDEATARRRALSVVGAGWEVVELTREG